MVHGAGGVGEIGGARGVVFESRVIWGGDPYGEGTIVGEYIPCIQYIIGISYSCDEG